VTVKDLDATARRELANLGVVAVVRKGFGCGAQAAGAITRALAAVEEQAAMKSTPAEPTNEGEPNGQRPTRRRRAQPAGAGAHHPEH
jgi:hypothetical protein